MNCIIIDDEATAQIILEELCNQEDNLNVLGSFSNAMEAIKFLNKNTVDLIFLDIHMPNFSGFDFIQTINNNIKIVLTTSDKNFAIEAFEYECIVDYLLKPITLERFAKSLKRVEAINAKSEKNNPTDIKANSSQTASKTNSPTDIYINIDRRLIKLNLESISVIIAKGDYIQIKTDTKNYTVHSTMKKLEEKLPPNLFLKVHRSYIINTKKIIDIEDNSVLIAKDVVPVSRSNRPELMKRLNLL